MCIAPATLEVLRSEYNFKMCNTTFQQIIKEMREQIRIGRYDACVLIDEKPIMVSPLAFIDYMANRKGLKDKNARKYVLPYDAESIARNYLGINSNLDYLEKEKIAEEASEMAVQKILERMGSKT